MKTNLIQWLLLILLVSPATVKAQSPMRVNEQFWEHDVTPMVLRDSKYELRFEQVRSAVHEAQFQSVLSPHFRFGNDPANWWMRFDLSNDTDKTRRLVLHFNRKNLDTLAVYAEYPDKSWALLDELTPDEITQTPYILTDGFHIHAEFPPGISRVFVFAVSRAGSMHMAIKVRDPENYALNERRNAMFFGVFCGVMAVSILFVLLLYVQSRDAVYIFYLAYVVNILMREANGFSADFGILPDFQRNITSVLVAATFSLFYRRMLHLSDLDPFMDRILKIFIGFILFASALIGWADANEDGLLLQKTMQVVNTANLIFTLVAVVESARFYKTSLRARIVLIAFLPLAVAFVFILLRNLNFFPNYPIIRFAVMWGFVFEVMIFTVGFAYYHRAVERERANLQLKLQIEKAEKQLAIQRVKDRIARDLHDDVAASMSGIRILSQVASRQTPKDQPEIRQLLDQIHQSARDTLESVSDLIWAVKPGKDYLNDIADRIRDHAAKVLEAQNIQCFWEIPRNLPQVQLDPEIRRNVFLVFKEAFNNALKYSACTAMTIGMNFDEGVLTLSIRDNGKGFDPAATPSGDGMGNMRRRAADIGGQVRVLSNPDEGTEVELRLPVSV